jgi:hypothetical protein
MPLALVINPYVTDFKLYDEWMHPLGLYFLIDLLRRNGFEVRFFNCLERTVQDKSRRFNTGDFPAQEIEKPLVYRSIPRKYKRYGKTPTDLRHFLESTLRPDIICIGSLMTYWLPGVTFTVEEAASVYPDVPTVIGGTATRLMPNAVRAMMAKNISVVGAAIGSDKINLHPALPPLRCEGPLSLLPGFHLLTQPLHGPVLTSLGCPMNCSYCASSLLQGPFRRRPIESIVGETAFLASSRNVKDFAFYDDALLHDHDDYLYRLLDSFSRLPHPIRFHAPNGLHIRAIDDRLAAAMKAAGFTTLRFGYESGAPEHTREVSAKSSRGEAVEKIACLKLAGYDGNDIGIYVMAGLPGQTVQQVLDEIDFFLDAGVKPKPVWLSPVPGTRLFDHYAITYPQIVTNPLWHNDMFFITQLPGWGWEATEEIRERARKTN